jgi:hypothetical protein
MSKTFKKMVSSVTEKSYSGIDILVFAILVDQLPYFQGDRGEQMTNFWRVNFGESHWAAEMIVFAVVAAISISISECLNKAVRKDKA